ncbi:MAG: V4R domain-containing protein [Thermodesulfobacteriota bacterium]
MTTKPKYHFNWGLLGNLDLGRPNLGPTSRLEVYRLLQFSLRDILERQMGTEKTDQIFHEAGKLAGSQFYEHVLDRVTDFDVFIKHIQSAFKDLGIGIFRVEQADLEAKSFIFTVSEDLDCSGLPELDYVICTYDEGFIAGLLESFAGIAFVVKEVDCWCTGARTCRFTAKAVA